MRLGSFFDFFFSRYNISKDIVDGSIDDIVVLYLFLFILEELFATGQLTKDVVGLIKNVLKMIGKRCKCPIKTRQKQIEYLKELKKIAEKYWPGPITLILKVKDKEIQKSLELDEKIAVRVPNNQCVLALLKECKLLVGTSANISGTASFNDPKECSKNLSGYDLLVDGGIISSQGESTIVEIDDGNVKVLRKGSISEEEINELN